MLVAIRTALPKPPAVVTHGPMIRAILDAQATLPVGMAVALHVANTSVTIVSGTPPHAVSMLGRTRHHDDDGASAGSLRDG